MRNSEVKKRLDHYRSSIFNSDIRLRTLSEERLLELVERAMRLPGDWKVQFERLLMETETGL